MPLDTSEIILSSIDSIDKVKPLLTDSIGKVNKYINLIQNYNCDPNKVSETFSFLPKLINNIGTILVGLIAMITALIQVRWNVISSARIKWLEAFKNDISELYEVAIAIHSFNNFYKVSSKSGNTKFAEKYYDEYTRANTKFNILSNRIILNLNPLESKHLDIENIIRELDIKFSPAEIENLNYNELEEKLKTIVLKSREISKEEWEKAKKIKIFKFWKL